MYEEVKRQLRVLDQMLSMHSALRDRYARREKLLTLGIMGCSVILCTVTFLPDDALTFVGISTSAKRFVIGGFASIVFFLSIAQLCVNWGKVATRHCNASEALAKLKHQYRAAMPTTGTQSSVCAELTQEYCKVMGKLPSIPDRQFASLKAYHLRKVRLSQMIDSRVGCPLWLLKLLLMWQGVRGSKNQDQEGDNS